MFRKYFTEFHTTQPDITDPSREGWSASSTADATVLLQSDASSPAAEHYGQSVRPLPQTSYGTLHQTFNPQVGIIEFDNS